MSLNRFTAEADGLCVKRLEAWELFPGLVETHTLLLFSAEWGHEKCEKSFVVTAPSSGGGEEDEHLGHIQAFAWRPWGGVTGDNATPLNKDRK